MARAVLEIDCDLCEKLARRALAGDEIARRQLVEHLWPHWVRIARSSRAIARRANPDEHARDIATRLAEKIAGSDGAALELFFRWQKPRADKGFDDWMRIVTSNAIRDHVRSLGARRRDPAADPTVGRLLGEFARSPAIDELGMRPPITAAQTARQLAEYAKRHLPREQLRALRSWLEGTTFDEMAVELSLGSAENARRVLRSGIAALRRKFSTAEKHA